MGLIEHIERPRPAVPTRHRVSVAELLRMDAAGVFDPEARIELIDGEVIDMVPIGTRHSGTVNRLNRALTSAAGAGAVVAVQNPLRLGDFALPQPDLLLLRPRDDFYTTVHPVPADVLLLIEVADSSARYDREIKLPQYARHGVCEVWLIDLDNRVASFHRAPHGDAYADVTRTDEPGVVAIAALPGAAIDLTGLLLP